MFKRQSRVFWRTLLLCIIALMLWTGQYSGASKGWVKNGKKIRYLTADGYIKDQVVRIGGKYYYFNKKGYRKTGWITWKKNRYYFQPKTGEACTGECEIEGSLYLFRKNGKQIVKKGDHKIGSIRYRVTEDTSAYRIEKGKLTKKKLKEAGIDKCTRLMIVAHPDDETFWGASHLMRSKKYFVVCLTNGDNDVRRVEFARTLEILGIRGIILDYPDVKDGVRSLWEGTICPQIRNDINRLLRYQMWDEIVTHNPKGEYGHIHHKMTSRLVTESCREYDQTEDLFYFGKYYSKENLKKQKKNLKSSRLTQKQLDLKEQILKQIYVSQPGAYEAFHHMNPYEKWVKASEWK